MQCNLSSQGAAPTRFLAEAPARTGALVGAALAWPLIPRAAHAGEFAYVEYSIGALVVLTATLIVLLLIQSRRHQRAKVSAEKRYAEMTHAARLALIGEITASVVHEVTQPLSAILSNVETAELLLGQPDPDLASIREILADVRKDDLRAHGILRRLRTLLRKRDLHFESVNLNALVSDALYLIRPDAERRNIAVCTALDPDLPAVPADPVHLQQVLLNLLINAMDAMKETPDCERRLDIRTQRRYDDFLEVAILDRGHGIAPEHASGLFDSFFTTKDDGLGLGLSIARSIIQMHGGAIWAENRECGGAAVKFTLRAP
ncbi:MAG TPA: ATP-binding protein [Steroidobacter sp.]|nr:ATP-binding protein [Steroidobacter sp.]